MDFTLKKYGELLDGFQAIRKSFRTFENFMEDHSEECIVLRHDVDTLPENSFEFAKIQKERGIKGSYYFRVVPGSFNERIISDIYDMGHEVGYHYEDVDLVSTKMKVRTSKSGSPSSVDMEKLIDASYESFCENLEKLRKLVPVRTICMHGSPMSKYDNRLIWKKYDYKKLGIIGEPYFDIDWNETGYLTDTGRGWNGSNVSIRDKVNSKYDFNLKTTQDIIDNIKTMPDKIMITFHPQRWSDDLIPWTKELIFQNVKNVVKGVLVKYRSFEQ